jgi:hypothetical protein
LSPYTAHGSVRVHFSSQAAASERALHARPVRGAPEWGACSAPCPFEAQAGVEAGQGVAYKPVLCLAGPSLLFCGRGTLRSRHSQSARDSRGGRRGLRARCAVADPPPLDGGRAIHRLLAAVGRISHTTAHMASKGRGLTRPSRHRWCAQGGRALAQWPLSAPARRGSTRARGPRGADRGFETRGPADRRKRVQGDGTRGGQAGNSSSGDGGRQTGTPGPPGSTAHTKGHRCPHSLRAQWHCGHCFCGWRIQAGHLPPTAQTGQRAAAHSAGPLHVQARAHCCCTAFA